MVDPKNIKPQMPYRAGDFEKGIKFGFVSQIEYADGAIVSKNVLKRAAGNISLFAFDKGESLSTHTAPFDALVQVLDGNAHITVGENLHIMQAGESIIMPAGIPHSVEAVEKFKMLLTMIKE